MLFKKKEKKSNNPKVSVLVPVYNVENYLQNCIDSLKKQTYDNLEIIFVNDASTDSCQKILQKAVKKMKNATLINHEKNKSLYLARWTALCACTGDYIAFLDSDDYVENNYYETVVNKMISSNADVCFSDFLKTDVKNKQILKPISFLLKQNINFKNGEFFKYLCENQQIKQDYLYVWNKMISRSLFEKCKPYLEEIAKSAEGLLSGEDNVYSIVFLSNANNVVNVHGTQLHYCVHDNQSFAFKSKEKFLKQLESSLRSMLIIRNYLEQVGLYKQYLPQVKAWEDIYKTSFKYFAYKLRCPKEYNLLLKQYGIKNI